MSKNVVVSWLIVIATLGAMVGAEWLFIGLALAGAIEFTTGLVAALLIWMPIMGVGGAIVYKWEKDHDIGTDEVSDSVEEGSDGDEQESISFASDSGTRTDADDGDVEHQS